MNARKIATSVPGAQFDALERTRRRLRLKRSEAIQEALALWIATREEDQKVALYIDGYQRVPDDAKEGHAYATAWATGVAPEDW